MTPTKDPDTEEAERNIGQQHWDRAVSGNDLASAERSAIDDMAGDRGDDTDPNSSRDRTKSAEEEGNRLIPKVNDPSPEAVANKGESEAKKDERGNRKDKIALNFMKKKGPLGLIGLLLAGGGGIFAALLSPGLAIVQLKEALTEDLNDAVSAMDERSQHIFRAKMKGQVSGICTKQVTVRCKYTSMSKTQVKKLARQGITVNADPDRRSLTNGRYKVDSLTFRDSAGNPQTISAQDFKERYRTDPHFRAAMNKFYSPRWMSVRDGAMDTVKNKFKLSFKRLINGKDRAAMADQLDTNVREGAQERDGRKVTVEEREVDGEKRKVYIDPDRPRDPEGNTDVVNGEDGKPLDVDSEESKINKLKQLTAGGTKKAFSTGLKASNIYVGTQEAVCSMLKLLRTAGIASRNIKFAQYMRYAMPFLNTADAIPLGTATPEQTEFIGDILSHKDMRDKVLSEASIPTDSNGDLLDNLPDGQPNLVPTANPHKGDDAFDAATVKASMYGSTSNLDLRESQASLSGNLGSAMVGFVDKVREWVPFGLASDSTCDFWTNPIVQGAGFILSVATIAVSCLGGCAGAGVAIGKAVATTSVIMMVTMMIQNQIADLVNGDAVSSESQGLDAGNAIFTGTAAFNSTSASSSGMTPLSTPEEIQQNNKSAMVEKQQYQEVAQLEAAGTPYDIYNQYSFLGSLAWSLAPIARASSSSVASMVSAPLSILSSVPQWLSPSTKAAIGSDPARFEKCEDEVLERINLNSADMACNLRWGLSEAQRNADPNKIVQWMIDSCQVDPVSGEVNPTGECAEGCKAGQGGSDQCTRTATSAQALAMLSSDSTQIASAMQYDDEGIDKPLASAQTQAAVQAADTTLPKSIGGGEPSRGIESPVEDVRTYAHFMRYCRFGPEDGRLVNFGDPDGKDDKSVLDGIDFSGGVYNSVGKECLTANNCKPGDDPNNAFPQEQERGLKFCRPAQYDIYAVYTMDKRVEDGMDQEESSGEGSADSGSGLVTGEAKELAKQVANNPNIEFVNPASKATLERFAETGEATNACGEKYGINPLLSGVMLANARKWKMKVNNFGFKEDRSFCDGSPSNQHRMGNAIDLNGIQKVGGASAGSDGWGSLSFSGGQTALATEFATDWMDNLATTEPTRGRSGQLGCGGYNLIAIKKPSWQGIDGLLHFDDSCDHLHIDVGDRVDQGKR